MRVLQRVLAALVLVLALSAFTIPAAGLAAPQHPVLDQIARAHHWNAVQVIYWEGVIHCESSGGCENHQPIVWQLHVWNGDCYGVAQLQGGPSAYYRLGGSTTSVRGELVAMASYIAERYGTPAAAWAHEMKFHWY